MPRISKFKVPNCYLIQAHSSSCRCTTTLAALHLLNSDSQTQRPLRRTFATSRPRSTIRAPRKGRASLIGGKLFYLSPRSQHHQRSTQRDRSIGKGTATQAVREICRRRVTISMDRAAAELLLSGFENLCLRHWRVAITLTTKEEAKPENNGYCQCTRLPEARGPGFRGGLGWPSASA